MDCIRGELAVSLQARLDAFKADFRAGKPPFSIPLSVIETMDGATNEPIRCGRGTSSVAARRLKVVWSGTRSVRPSRPVMEPIKPSVWRKARRNTARKVNAVTMATGEYQGWPPRIVRGSASQAAIASSVNQTGRLPR
jgi:hypothetical protein